MELPRLDLGSTPGPYRLVLQVLLVLFVLRVVGQLVVLLAAPTWLPPMRRWYSGLMPYRYLLPAQVAIIVLMLWMLRLGPPDHALGFWTLAGSYVYAAGMVFRGVRYLRAPPDRRGVLIPILFHFVLAGFLFVFASWHVRGHPTAP